VKRLFRILVTTLTVLSLILLAAMIALWVRSYRLEDKIQRDRGPTRRDVLSIANGRLALGHIRLSDQYREFDRDTGDQPAWLHVASEMPQPYYPMTTCRIDRRFAGFAYQRGIAEVVWDCQAVTIPMWAVTLSLSVLPIVRLRKLTKRGVPTGRCPECGYDLRATPDRCPECGTIPTKTDKGSGINSARVA
jgi:hypothetical protein